jgi:hypothetical protein
VMLMYELRLFYVLYRQLVMGKQSNYVPRFVSLWLHFTTAQHLGPTGKLNLVFTYLNILFFFRRLVGNIAYHCGQIYCLDVMLTLLLASLAMVNFEVMNCVVFFFSRYT